MAIGAALVADAEIKAASPMLGYTRRIAAQVNNVLLFDKLIRKIIDWLSGARSISCRADLCTTRFTCRVASSFSSLDRRLRRWRNSKRDSRRHIIQCKL
jgi:hypothetical protein